MSCETTTTGTMRSRLHRTAAVLTVLGALVAAPQAQAACDGGEAELNEAIGAALGAWTSANRPVYTKARAVVEGCLEETRDVLAPATVAAWFRFQAVDVLFTKKDVGASRLALAASHHVDPAFAWGDSVLVTNSDLPPMIEEAKALSPGDTVAIAQDEVLRTYINGRPATERPALLPVLLQVEARGVGVMLTTVLAPGQDWRPEEIPTYDLARSAWMHRQRVSTLGIKAGGGLLGTAALVGGGTILGATLIRERSEQPDALTDALMLSAGGQIGAGVLAGAGLSVLMIGVGMRF